MRSDDPPRIRAGELDPESARLLLDLALDGATIDPPSVPERFGEHELLGERGSGSSGTVYEARDPAGRLVALKRMDGPLTPEAVRRFRREAQLTRSLHHPDVNIVRVLEIGEHEGRPFFTMELLDGTLNHAAVAMSDSAALMAKIARAVHHAHTRKPGVLHRDLKPANILLDASGTPYVADFGLARRVDQDATNSQGTMAGTLDYMAPEQPLADPNDLTPAADIYSLGVIFYELLTGDVPVRGATVREFLERLWSAEPVVPPRKLAPRVARSYQNICLLCLENDPERRYLSAEELAVDLESAHAGRVPPRA